MMQDLTNQCVTLEVAFVVSVELDAWLIVLGTFSDDPVLAERLVNLIFGDIEWQR